VTVDCVWEVLGVSGVYVDLARVVQDCLWEVSGDCRLCVGGVGCVWGVCRPC